MEELYRQIEETVKNAGCPYPVSGEEIYNEICDEIEGKEPGEYAFFSKKTDTVYFEYRIQIFEDNFNLSNLMIHVKDQVYDINFD